MIQDDNEEDAVDPKKMKQLQGKQTSKAMLKEVLEQHELINHIRLETTEQQKEISKRLTQNAVQFKKERID